MQNDQPTILGYATPEPTNRFAQLPLPIIILVAVLVPGLSSSLIRGSVWRCLRLLAIIPAAFIVFGPIWGEILFPSPRLTNLGLYPFVFTCAAVEILSVMLAVSDRNRALSGGAR